jgi:hypothetical protein
VSGYTIGEILVWMVLAAALGFALGWIARELLLRSRSRSAPPVRSPVPVARPEPARSVGDAAVKKAPAKKAAAKKAPAKKATDKKPPAKKAAPPQGPDDT